VDWCCAKAEKREKYFCRHRQTAQPKALLHKPERFSTLFNLVPTNLPLHCKNIAYNIAIAVKFFSHTKRGKTASAEFRKNLFLKVGKLLKILKKDTGNMIIKGFCDSELRMITVLKKSKYLCLKQMHLKRNHLYSICQNFLTICRLKFLFTRSVR